MPIIKVGTSKTEISEDFSEEASVETSGVSMESDMARRAEVSSDRPEGQVRKLGRLVAVNLSGGDWSLVQQ